MYHENDVEHVKYTGTLNVIPGASYMTPAPTVQYPDRLAFTSLALGGKTPSIRYFPYGLAIAGRVSMNMDSNFIYNRLCITSSPFYYEWVEIVAQKAYPGLAPSINRLRAVMTSQTNLMVYMSSALIRQSSGLTVAKNSDWFKRQSPAAILKLADKLLSQAMPIGGSPSGRGPIESIGGTFSPSGIFNSIDSLISQQFKESSFNLPGVHMGDLAAKASEGVNRSNVNMIAFLKDLRKPQELIPKLRNLTKLKTHSSNYLAINYGVLPTISDLQGIMGALKKIKPYIDTNGFSTYNAVHSEAETIGKFSYDLEQRIKIAIDKEDSQFIDVLNKLESSGFAPTLENIWDLVPYSFIVDWFIDIGGFLERVDTTFRLERMNIRYATKSYKRTTSVVLVPGPSMPVSGTLSVVNYQRRTDGHSPLPPLSLSSENKLPSHWLEATALIIQRAK